MEAGGHWTAPPPRKRSLEYAGLRGEGLIPVPLPPPACPRPRILRVNSRAIRPRNSSDFSFELRRPDRQLPAYCSPKAPFLSEALDSIHSVRFSKFERLELLMNFSGKRLCRFSRTTKKAKSLRLPSTWEVPVRYLPRQPAIPAFSQRRRAMRE
jgi:hypothetical protein